MRISYNTDPGNFNTAVGYGHAGFQIVQSLQRLGHTVPWADFEAPVELWFCQPEYWEFSNPYATQYKIGYWPWESTKLHESWYFHLDKADELWTTSQWCKEVYEKEIGRPVHVYEHGIEHVWTPKLRNPGDTLRFLHVGEPAERKAGQETVNAFIDVFGSRRDVSLTMKAHNINTTRKLDRQGFNAGSITDFPNINLITDEYTDEQMIQLFHDHDVLIYPSWGEGFGFIPLQALATGMPVICTKAWAPYGDFLGQLGLASRLAPSPWPVWHTGDMHEPDKEDLRELLKLAYDDYEYQRKFFYAQAPLVHERYDWDNVTERAFAHIVEKFS